MSELANRFFEKALTAIRGNAYHHALNLLVEAIKLKPDFTEAWVVRANVLHSLSGTQTPVVPSSFDALLCYDRAINVNPNAQDAWNNRGLAFADLGMWDSAEASFRESDRLLPALEPRMGLANMYCTIMRLKDAAAEYRRAIEASPDWHEAHFNLGVTLLGLGEWHEGFKEYAWRWGNTPYPPRAFRNYPKWAGEDLTGKTILLYPEQGYGDEILALRFASELYARYDRCTVIVQARTPALSLARGLALSGRSQLFAVSMHDETKWPAQFSCPLLDVPAVLGITWKNVPRPDRYLKAQDGNVNDWRSRIATLTQGLNVGLCWSSGGHLDTARAAQQAKSIPLHWLKGLALTGVNLISLQHDRREPIPDGLPITDWMGDVHDLGDTAALIEALDLVISVDTSVAHLAGSLGKPVWNFVRFSGYWPWLAPDVPPSPEHSIWYPSMTLFRQPRLADWHQPIEAAIAKLRGMLA